MWRHLTSVDVALNWLSWLVALTTIRLVAVDYVAKQREV